MRFNTIGALAGLLALRLGFATPALAGTPPASAAPGRPKHTVSYDSYSFIIDGKRTFLWSGEFHPFRLPSPPLWTDVFQKMRAAGFDAVSLYFSWGYHSPQPGVYDFSGVRDVDRVLDAAQRAGLYVIARPGPYINAEVDSGGFPLWMTTQSGEERSSDPNYLRHADEWLTRIDRIIARHQVVDGRGSVIAYQVENEYYNSSAAGREYMAHLEAKARADGIQVLLVGNHNQAFVSGLGAVQVSGWDHYPQGFNCWHPSIWQPVPEVSQDHGPGEPIYLPEYQGGAFDPWGGPGYRRCAQLINANFANVFYKENIAEGATAMSFYMLYGGTSWGWQAIPENYTSYDYGAAITEARQLDPKYYEDKRIGYLVTTTPALLKTTPLTPATLDDPQALDLARINPDTHTQFHLIRHRDSTAGSTLAVHLRVRLDGRELTIPRRAGTAIDLIGRESKLLLVDFPFGYQRLSYSTSEVMSTATIGGRDFLVLYGDAGTPGETSLRVPGTPRVHVLQGSAEATPIEGGVQLNYRHDGLTEVEVAGGRRPLLVLIADRRTTDGIWRQDMPDGTVLMIGSHLLRSAGLHGRTLALTGDTGTDAAARIFAPPAPVVTWNGQVLRHVRASIDGSISVNLPTAVPVHLPQLRGWLARDGAPEIERNFDDHDWRVATLSTTNSVTVPGSLPVLFADDYGFHVGNTWYRGHFRGDAAQVPKGLKLQVLSGGSAGAFSVWLNGRFLGSVQRRDTGTFTFPPGAVMPGDNVIAVLTVDMGHEEYWGGKISNRAARGIVAAIPVDAPPSDITWRLQGERGGDHPVRGPYNEGGLDGERKGWLQNGERGAGWAPVELPTRGGAPGVTWYTTRVELHLPTDQDTSVGIRFRDPPDSHYRATLFVNGWMMGEYVSDIGPQHTFPIPNGILHPHGNNRIDIAVWKTDTSPGGLGNVELVNLGSWRSPLPGPSTPGL